MRLPGKFPGLTWATILVALYAAIWITLEGNLGREIALALGIILLCVGYLGQRFLGGRTLSLGSWLLIAGLVGFLIGLGIALLTLILMGIKTGLHAHGPEFSRAQIEWVLRQLPIWAAAGSLAGLGFGALLAERQKQI